MKRSPSEPGLSPCFRILINIIHYLQKVYEVITHRPSCELNFAGESNKPCVIFLQYVEGRRNEE